MHTFKNEPIKRPTIKTIKESKTISSPGKIYIGYEHISFETFKHIFLSKYKKNL